MKYRELTKAEIRERAFVMFGMFVVAAILCALPLFY